MLSLIKKSKNKNNKRIKGVKGPSPVIILLVVAIFFNGCSIFTPQTGSLEGVVHRQTTNSTAPLSEALICVSGSENTTYTDQDGYFLLNEIPAGKRTLTVIKEGYVTLKLLNINIEPNIINQVYFGEPIILPPKEDTILYDTAMEYLEQENYEQAFLTFQEIRDNYPDSPWADDAQYYLGYIYEISKFYITARDEYSLLLFYYPGSPWADNARLGIGNCYYYTGDYYHAQIQYQAVIDNYPTSDLCPQAQYRIAWCNRRLGNYTQAILDFQQMIDLYPTSIYTPPAQYFMGETYCNDLHNYDQAIFAFQMTINNYPLSTWPDETRLIAPAAYFYLGFCNEKLEKWEEALAAYQVIIDEYPTSTWDNGDSIAEDAQERIDFIIENYLPPEESPSDE